ncbi:MAG: hypothetical protein ACI89L_002506 [Phycisphaerales bacterium]
MEFREDENNDGKTVIAMGKTIFVTGATGYIGGRLVPRLTEGGYRVVCLARDPEKLAARPWANHPGIQIVKGDLTDVVALTDQLSGCDAAYYLVHSMMTSGSEYADQDLILARRFAEAAKRAGVERIVYLGGLGETGPGLSRHLSSRREVENALGSHGVPVTVLRAAMIIGSGSASFEILRYLVERLPVMITPRWVRTECQPIAIRDVLWYLIETLEHPMTIGKTLEIGGPDVMTYHEIMTTMASARGLPRRLIIPVPLLTPRLSSLWIHLITPLSHRIARPLAEGLRNRVVCKGDMANSLMPHRCLSVRDSMDAALGCIQENQVETSWSDAGVMPGDADWAGGTSFEDRRSKEIHASPESVFAAVCRVGGGQGYYAADWLWRVRGAIDRMVGGPGLRRGRRDSHEIEYGDAVDFWRVTAVKPGSNLELRAEMKLPGLALLGFNIEPSDKPGISRLEQFARFKPKGLLGILYWYAVLPFHSFIFSGMLRGIVRKAESIELANKTQGSA